MMLLKSLASLCILAVVAFAVPAQEKRIHHNADLSDHIHNDAHGFQYDHEAFLGKEEAKTFDQLTPKESKDKLAKIVDRIDTDKDGYVTHAELHYWIKHRQRRYIEENVNKHWNDYDKNQDGKIGWEEYKNTTYGYYLDEEFDDVEDKATYKSMLTRDERRFKTADRDGDGIATREEFTAFLHPEEFDYMRDLVVQETVEDIDKNRDGKINIDEYIGDMYTPENGESEPDWIKTERKHFSEFRDANKDGYLDAGEVSHWILPGEVDHADNEAKHLIHETDTDKDGRLTLSELLDKMDYIKTSTITDYGGLNSHVLGGEGEAQKGTEIYSNWSAGQLCPGLPPIDSTEEVLAKLTPIMNNSSHLLHETVEALNSSFSNRLLLPPCKKESYHRSFIPTAGRFFNTSMTS